MELYKLDRAIADVIESGYSVDDDTGEIMFEPTDLERLEADRGAKLEACAIYAKNLQAEIEAFKAESERLQARLKARQRKLERMQQYVLSSMLYMGDTSFETPRVALRTRKSVFVDVYEPDKLPVEYMRHKVTASPDKAAIKADIQAGEVVPGAELVERISLAIK